MFVTTWRSHTHKQFPSQRFTRAQRSEVLLGLLFITQSVFFIAKHARVIKNPLRLGAGVKEFLRNIRNLIRVCLRRSHYEGGEENEPLNRNFSSSKQYARSIKFSWNKNFIFAGIFLLFPLPNFFTFRRSANWRFFNHFVSSGSRRVLSSDSSW